MRHPCASPLCVLPFTLVYLEYSARDGVGIIVPELVAPVIVPTVTLGATGSLFDDLQFLSQQTAPQTPADVEAGADGGGGAGGGLSALSKDIVDRVLGEW